MEETKEKKRFSFPGVAWLKARLSRKILFITAIFILVCLLLTSIIFLRYLREFVSVHYDRAIEETGRMADEVSSFLLGSDGETAALPAFLNARQLLCTVHDADGKLLFDSRDGAPDSVYSTVCAERTVMLADGSALHVEVQSAAWSRDALTGDINGRIRAALLIYIGVMSLFAVLLIYFVMIVPVSQLRETMRKYYESGMLPARSERKDEIGRLQNTFAELAGVLDAKEKTERRMIASISHDIKTPLTSVLGCSERLLTAELSEEKKQQYLNSIHDKAISIKSIVDEFDDYLAAGLRGGAPLQLMTAAALCDDIRAEYEAELADAHVVLKTACACPQAQILCNTAHMRRYFGNLVGNSIRHSGAENLVLTLDCHMEDGQVVFDFSDNGVGVAPELLRQIFEPLYTSDRGRKLSGLGLAICKSIITAHGGTIRAIRATDGGLLIRAALPCAKKA